MVVELPWPETIFQAAWFFTGFMLSRTFSKKLDFEIMKMPEVLKLRKPWQILIGAILNFLHWFIVGLLIMAYSPQETWSFWLGLGLTVADIPDIPPRFLKIFAYLAPPEEEEPPPGG